MIIKVSGGQFFAEGFPIRRGFVLSEGKETAISCLSERGTGYALLRAVGEEPILAGGGIEVVRWKQGVELRPAPNRDRSVRRRTFSDRESYLQVALSSGECGAIRIEGSIDYAREIPFPLRAPYCELLTGQREPLLEVRAASDDREYLSFLSFGAEGVRLLLEEVGDEILCAGNEVTVTKSFRDLRERKRVTRYLWRGDHFDCSREYLCANAHPFMREQSGRLLLEAIFAGDEKDACSLLSPDLADFSALTRYFGEMITVRPPLFEAPSTAVAAEYRERDFIRAVLYDFDFDPSGKIVNIRNLDDPS